MKLYAVRGLGVAHPWRDLLCRSLVYERPLVDELIVDHLAARLPRLQRGDKKIWLSYPQCRHHGLRRLTLYGNVQRQLSVLRSAAASE